MSEKSKLRQIALKLRKDAYSRDDGMAARLVAAQIIMLPELDRLKSIACYFTIKDELDCLITLKALHAARFRLSLPAIVSDNEPLEFRSWNMREDLKPGPFGTREAIGETVTPEVVLVPLVAFDKNGGRLGYGGGYYDRTLEKLRNENSDVVVIGLAYDGQKLDAVPMESYDQRLDMVVTEKEIYRFK